MNDCEKINWKAHGLKPEKRRFKAEGPFFYYYREEAHESLAKETAGQWRTLGFNARITKTKTRGMHGVKHGSWLKGRREWHVWVGEKQR
jgi:hypothetical protein